MYKHGLTKEKLQEECSQEIILKLAAELKNLDIVGQHLNIPHTKDQGKVAMLDTWQKKEGRAASYMKLAYALYNSGNQDAVDLLLTERAKMTEQHSRQIYDYWTPERIAGAKPEPMLRYQLRTKPEPMLQYEPSCLPKPVDVGMPSVCSSMGDLTH